MYEKILLKLASKALSKGDFPVSAIIVKDKKIISKAYNKKESNQNAIHHAEIIAIEKACKKLKTWRLEECEMYVTMEPCIMCFGAISQARIKQVYYYYNNPKFGCESSKVKSGGYKNVNLKLLRMKEEKYKEMIKNFFKDKRNRES
jgi:tRNA(adenine34) deaminase